MQSAIITDSHSPKDTTTPATARIIDLNRSVFDVVSESLIQVFSSHRWEVYCGLNVADTKRLEPARKNLLTFIIQTNGIDRLIVHVVDVKRRVVSILQTIAELFNLFLCQLKNICLLHLMIACIQSFSDLDLFK